MMRPLVRALLLVGLLATLSVPMPSLAQPAPRLRIVLVLDASGSMAANDPQRLVRVAAKMLADLADERDHVTVISFGTEAKTLASTSGQSHEPLRAAIDTLGRNESCTDYGRALQAAAAAMPGPPAPAERRVVLFLTDGKYEATRAPMGCIDFERATDADRQPLLDAVDESIRKLSASRARVFAIGLGAAPARAAQSSALLRRVASETGGRFVEARTARDVPRVFAHIFGALVGAPVMQWQLTRDSTTIRFDIPRGADRMHVVLVPQSPADLATMRLDRTGEGAGPVPLEAPRVESGTSSGYEVGHVVDHVAGSYQLSGKPTGPVEILVIPDVGLGLRFEGVAKILPEQERLAGAVALRTRAGDPVELAPEFLSSVTLTVFLGKDKVFDQAPDRHGVATFRSAQPLPRGAYVLRATALHSLGLLDVPAVEVPFTVMPQFELRLSEGRAEFDTMAELGPIRVAPVHPFAVEVASPAELPADIRVSLALPEGQARTDLVLSPTELTFGPGKPRRVEVSLAWSNPKQLRGEEHRYDGMIVASAHPDDARLLTTATAWSFPLDGTLRAWTLARYVREYRWQLGAALALLLLLVWVIGRRVAGRFPEKARIRYVEVGQQFESDSLMRRHVRRGAYRSARIRFPLGKRARPLATFRAEGRAFAVEPAVGVTVTILDDALPAADREQRKPFPGRWDQRYQLSDRYEVWLTRS